MTAQASGIIALQSMDYVLIGLFLLVTILIAGFFSRKNRTLSGYFQAEGSLPWFVAGTAMVATTFAADTPLAVTELVATKGISGNWAWWYMSLGAVVTVFVFAPLWKRSGVLTDLEFLMLRYRGRGADWLRGSKAVYLGGFMNAIILAWVNLAMLKILESFLSSELAAIVLIGLFAFGVLYTVFLGLGGISFVDVFQFFFAMAGCIVLAVYSIGLPEVGGFEGMKQQLPSDFFSFFPPRSEWGSFSILVLVLWWVSWYPGSEPGGGGYIAQRILSARSELDASKASLWFLFAHYFVRPWPWIIVALASLILFPNLPSGDQGKGFIYMIGKSLGNGGKGFLIATFLAAYLSTIATHLNWGASYLVNDLAKPYIWKGREDSKYLHLSYVIQVLSGISSLLICFYAMNRVSSAWFFLIEASSGIGFALVFRWFWWRIHAWSELTGFLVSPIVFAILKITTDLVFPYSAMVGAGITIGIVIAVTYLFPETDTSYLKEFYARVRPGGLGWEGWLQKMNVEDFKGYEASLDKAGLPTLRFRSIILLCLLSILSVFSGLGGIGKLFFGEAWEFMPYLVVFAISSGILIRNLSLTIYNSVESDSASHTHIQ